MIDIGAHSWLADALNAHAWQLQNLTTENRWLFDTFHLICAWNRSAIFISWLLGTVEHFTIEHAKSNDFCSPKPIIQRKHTFIMDLRYLIVSAFHRCDQFRCRTFLSRRSPIHCCPFANSNSFLICIYALKFCSGIQVLFELENLEHCNHRHYAERRMFMAKCWSGRVAAEER